MQAMYLAAVFIGPAMVFRLHFASNKQIMFANKSSGKSDTGFFCDSSTVILAT